MIKTIDVPSLKLPRTSVSEMLTDSFKIFILIPLNFELHHSIKVCFKMNQIIKMMKNE